MTIKTNNNERSHITLLTSSATHMNTLILKRFERPNDDSVVAIYV